MVVNYGPHKKTQTHSAGDGAMLGVSLRDQIRNVEIRRRTRVTDIARRVAKLKWQWAGHIVRRKDPSFLQTMWPKLGSQGAGMAAPNW
ncbi:jg25564 [Pararge aegeria aegeria]|uniref:Jg25564 protein n=1 Tax=Pararge aegeria aegeria TaxID=348720 RepID=A0A8S4RWY8_9NEOP|nr:jg25564 [Pararge aegeria aegeria]